MSTTAYTPTRAWWKSAVVYQLYPSSFLDSNGDGIGDLPGITSKLDYLKELGVDVLWMSPIYCSPQADMGYDISDYRNIDPRFGTLEDYDHLVKGAHERGMKVMMDLVVNHTSDEHAWFEESRSSKDNSKRDWYIWRNPRFDEDGHMMPPNNWRSVFQGSAWDYDEKTEQYYLHLYVSKQPDLNWDNSDVRDAVWEVMRFWIGRGCDGFRMDVINLVSKVEGLPDAPVSDRSQFFQHASSLYANGPRVHQYLQQMNKEVLSKHDLITVGETPFTHDDSVLAEYVLPDNKELNMVFQFEIMDLDSPPEAPLLYRPWKLTELKGIINKWQTYKRESGFWNAVFIENHDHARSVSRFGNDTDAWRTRSAQVLAMLEIAQGGTMYVYQGQEIGIRNFPRSWGVEEYKDVASINYWEMIKAQRAKSTSSPNFGPDMSDLLDSFQKKARDHARTPMQWDASPHAGFTRSPNGPWMRANDDYPTWNVAAQRADSDSVLGFWRRAIRTRKEWEGVLVYGDFELLLPEHERVFGVVRKGGDGEVAVVLLNFGEEEVDVKIEKHEVCGTLDGYELVLGNYDDAPKGLEGEVKLKGWEGRVYVRAAAVRN
ncbi:glycoside hydrolase family 13 protein [Coniophora puteana RWD-64-598 SS2]|uniref:Glycoside hydrolase family 13 protein n=1 Tax=Coniophora puteana (strain RWD-64-598) TaxID=741705 RepID=A0A5M3N390_CONPW|nr:glycoside hydrolase family 13 protein [Coniophora puteana RWD-64-598 SS2]EIW85879.1 glycoside hydrolase family 13 protein [Coniophora puteana RWD-64-598 SS2]